jgi:23S rRNA (uracil1939-C5)-methyltransferase
VSEPVEILRLGHAGDGVASDGSFVRYTVPGDVVRVSPFEIVTPGPSRILPACSHFGKCGGCALQHVERETYLAWKRALVIAALAQRGFADVPAEPIRAVGPGTRRRAVFKARATGKGVALGFYEPESQNLVDIGECPILVPQLEQSLPNFRRALKKLMRAGDGADLHVTSTESGLDVSLKWKRATSPDVLMDLSSFAQEMSLARLIWNGELVALSDPPMIRIGKHKVYLPPESFLQPTEEGETILRATVAEGVGDRKRIADLFAGCGAFALALAEGRTILAAEDNAEMIAALAAAARERGSDVAAERRDLFRRPFLPAELQGFDAVVINPPRPGAKAQCEQLARSAVAKIVYVSCNPASFSRDARLLCDGGFALKRVFPVDQFVWSPHVELVAELERVA